MTFVILTGGIDLSVGVGGRADRDDRGVAAGERLAARRWSWSSCCSIGARLGLAMGCVIHFFEIQPFIVTLAGMFLARGLCYVISTESIPITDPLFTAVAQGTVPLPGDTFVSPCRRRRCWSSWSAAYVLHAHPVRAATCTRSAATSSRRC